MRKISIAKGVAAFIDKADSGYIRLSCDKNGEDILREILVKGFRDRIAHDLRDDVREALVRHGAALWALPEERKNTSTLYWYIEEAPPVANFHQRWFLGSGVGAEGLSILVNTSRGKSKMRKAYLVDAEEWIASLYAEFFRLFPQQSGKGSGREIYGDHPTLSEMYERKVLEKLYGKARIEGQMAEIIRKIDESVTSVLITIPPQHALLVPDTKLISTPFTIHSGSSSLVRTNTHTCQPNQWGYFQFPRKHGVHGVKKFQV